LLLVNIREDRLGGGTPGRNSACFQSGAEPTALLATASKLRGCAAKQKGSGGFTEIRAGSASA
jgi:hypothetical protein